MTKRRKRAPAFRAQVALEVNSGVRGAAEDCRWRNHKALLCANLTMARWGGVEIWTK